MKTPSVLVCLTLALSIACADEAARTQRWEGVDAISQDAIQSALQVLRKDYIRPEELTFDQLNRAAMQGLLERLSFGASLYKPLANPASAPAPRVLSELLTPQIGYVRPVAFVRDEVNTVEKALKDFSAKSATHVILDLRAAAQPADLETASALAELFFPRGEMLFKLRALGGGDARLLLSIQEPVWTGRLIVLVDAESNNVAETLAAVLKQKKRALLIGSSTKGATVRYEELPLDGGWRLRFASAEVLLADDQSVFKRGVEPDFKVPQLPQEKKDVTLHLESAPARSLVFEAARQRWNEKALVAGTNPEYDDFVARSAGKRMGYDTPPVRDTVLQRAVDLIQNTAAEK